MSTPSFLLITAILLPGVAQAEIINFDDAKSGQRPPAGTAIKTGKGDAKWTIEKDETPPSKPSFLKQSGEATSPVSLRNGSSLKNGFVEVKFKPVSAKEDQAGGVVWRAKDSDNYYVARANALEDSVCIYHTIKGNRTEKKRTQMKVGSGTWRTLRVDFHENHFTVILDAQKAVEWNDAAFQDAGMVGVSTKADNVTLFDDFSFGSK